MNQVTKLLLHLFFISTLSSCATVCPQSEVSPKVAHVVICWLKTPGDESARLQLVERSKEFRKIPGVMAVLAGQPLPSDRSTVDDSFDVAVTILFKNEEALRAYDKNPIHTEAVKTTLIPLVKKFVVYDYRVSE
jgi:hypothetical protein